MIKRSPGHYREGVEYRNHLEKDVAVSEFHLGFSQFLKKSRANEAYGRGKDATKEVEEKGNSSGPKLRSGANGCWRAAPIGDGLPEEVTKLTEEGKIEKPTNPQYIEEHVDNDSIITWLLVLGEHGVDYLGGKNRFVRGEENGHHREIQTQKGSLVLFRGERLKHSITPVTHGCRIILQGEFSKT